MKSALPSSVTSNRPILSRRAKPIEKSLARQLYEAADCVTRVREGVSLNEGGLNGVSDVDRAAVQALVYGYLRAYGRYESILAALLKNPVKMTWVESLLGLALYRLQDEPESSHTVVNQAVEAVGFVAEGRYRALANGVLRNYLRQQKTLDEAKGSLAQEWGHPAWWVQQLQRDHPAHWQNILLAGNQHPPMTLRINPRKTTAENWAKKAEAVGVGISSIEGQTISLTRPVGVSQLPGFYDGEVSVQDGGAQQAAILLGAKEGERVLDACSAPGGKTAHMLEQADLDLLALDISAERCERVRENLKRLGLNAKVAAADCAAISTWWDKEPFDAVLADVPCTASGVARRFPDIKWLRQEGDPAKFARTQQKILAQLAQVVRPGGRILYATCSVFNVENQGQIASFLRRNAAWKLAGEWQLLPCEKHDGFYYALLTKANEQHG